MRYLRFVPLAFSIALMQCGRAGKVAPGTYAVADQEYSSQNYSLERKLAAGGGFEERHVVDHCLLLELAGTWIQEGSRLKLAYARSRNRHACRDSLPDWAADSSRLEIPIRNVQGTGYEALLAASDGKPEKWIRWMKTE